MRTVQKHGGNLVKAREERAANLKHRRTSLTPTYEKQAAERTVEIRRAQFVKNFGEDTARKLEVKFEISPLRTHRHTQEGVKEWNWGLDKAGLYKLVCADLPDTDAVEQWAHKMYEDCKKRTGQPGMYEGMHGHIQRLSNALSLPMADKVDMYEWEEAVDKYLEAYTSTHTG